MGKPAGADGGKGISARMAMRVQKPELPGQASEAMGSPFALTR
jgi:hypothetical protein